MLQLIDVNLDNKASVVCSVIIKEESPLVPAISIWLFAPIRVRAY